MANPEWLTTILTGVILPIMVSVSTYILVDRLGEWKRRKMYSRLGVAILESLQEEVDKGIELMKNALEAAQNNNATTPPPELLPNKSWSGMSTIPDDVLLRIIETSAKRTYNGFPPRKCRIHCKNYFEHMCLNYKMTLNQSLILAAQGQDWRLPLHHLLADDSSHYIQSAIKVRQMLEYSKQLLEKNAKTVFPK